MLLWSCFRVALELLWSCFGVAVELCWESLWSCFLSHLKSLEDLYHQNKSLLVGFMLQTMSIYDDTKTQNSLDFKIKQISFNSRKQLLFIS